MLFDVSVNASTPQTVSEYHTLIEQMLDEAKYAEVLSYADLALKLDDKLIELDPKYVPAYSSKGKVSA